MASYKSNHFNINLPAESKSNFNLGLLFYKYASFYYDFKPNIYKDYILQLTGNAKEWKKTFLQRFVNLSSHASFTKLNKRIQVLKGFAGAAGFVNMQTQSRFLCGVGYQSGLEWGFNFDWTTGVPYLPGSSFKGALLSFLEFCQSKGKPLEKWGEEEIEVFGVKWKKQQVKDIFGSQGEKEEKQAGNVIFFDVYPENFKDGFEIDVITPHYKEYYSSPEKYPPADIYNPTPLHFLTVKPGVSFVFMFKFRKEEDKYLRTKLINLIKECGKNYGFGAKTATGYGYFEEEP